VIVGSNQAAATKEDAFCGAFQESVRYIDSLPRRGTIYGQRIESLAIGRHQGAVPQVHSCAQTFLPDRYPAVKSPQSNDLTYSPSYQQPSQPLFLPIELSMFEKFSLE
jgi:hypothetical protein